MVRPAVLGADPYCEPIWTATTVPPPDEAQRQSPKVTEIVVAAAVAGCAPSSEAATKAIAAAELATIFFQVLLPIQSTFPKEPLEGSEYVGQDDAIAPVPEKIDACLPRACLLACSP